MGGLILRLKLGCFRLGSELNSQAGLEVRSESWPKSGQILGWPKSTTNGKELRAIQVLGANQSQLFVLKYHLLAGGLSASYKIFQCY